MPQIFGKLRDRSAVLLITGLVVIVVATLSYALISVYLNYLAQEQYNHLVSQTALLETQGNFAEIASLNSAYATDKTHAKNYRGQAWIKAGNAYTSEGDWKAGLQAYLNAENITGLTYEEAAGAAQAAIRLHLKDVAKHYLQEELTLLPKAMTFPQLQRNLINQELSQLN